MATYLSGLVAKNFEWKKYLKEIDAEAAPKCLFKKVNT